MMDWLRDNVWAAWLGIAVVLGLAELASLDFTLLMLAAGAITAAGVGALFPNLLWLQIVIGLTSAALADRLPRSERVSDVVVSASYAVLGRWREQYDELDHQRAKSLLAELGIGHLS